MVKSRRRATATTQPRWLWSGVAAISFSEKRLTTLRSIATLLPTRQSTLDQIAQQLCLLGARYHRYLHQDEFGPSRAEQMAALQVLLDSFRTVLHLLRNIPPHMHDSFPGALQPDRLRSEIPEGYAEVMKHIYEAAKDFERMSTFRSPPPDEMTRRLIEELENTSFRTLELLHALDTNTTGQLFLDSCAKTLTVLGPDAGELTPLSATCVWLERAHRLFDQTLKRLKAQKGPEPQLSLPWLVWALCDLWKRETGREVTSSAVANGDYVGVPQSSAGQFVVAAVEALHPTAEWIEEHEFLGMPVRARSTIGTSGDRARAAYFAMRNYVAGHPPAGVRRGRPRKSK